MMETYFKKILKRDGRVEEFDYNVFKVAIESAALAVGNVIDIDEVAQTALKHLSEENTTDTTSVEAALDAIEISLMKYEYSDVAKAFIIYRNKHARAREQSSVFTQAIDTINLDFEIKGNAAEWLWNVAHVTSYYYTLYNILPQRLSHYFTENYIWIHGLPYFGKTIRNISFDVENFLDSTYLEKKNIKPPKRIMVAMNHILQANDAVHDDIGGEQVYANFDVSMDNVINRLPQKPKKTDLQQAAEYLVYTLNNKSITHTIKTKTPCLNIGLNIGEQGQIFINYLISALLRLNEKSDKFDLPYIVFKMHPEISMESEAPNHELFNNCLRLARRRGNVSFIWTEKDDNNAYYSNGIKTPVSQSTSLQLTLNLPKIALNSKGNFYENLDNIITIAEDIITTQKEYLEKRTLENFPNIKNFPVNGYQYVSGENRFSNVFRDCWVMIGITGLSEALKILNPNASFSEIDTLAQETTTRIKKRIHLQNKNYKLMSSYDLKITNSLYENDRQRTIFNQMGINRYSPGITLLPVGYNIKDRINLEKNCYNNFDMPVPVLIQREHEESEILEGITKIMQKNAILTVI